WLRSAPLPDALDRAFGGSRVVDVLLILSVGVLVSLAAAQFGLGKRGAIVAGFFAAVHPAVWGAIPLDARGVLLGNLFGTAAIVANHRIAGGLARAAAVGLLLLLTLLSGSAAALGGTLFIAFLSLNPATQSKSAGIVAFAVGLFSLVLLYEW